MKPILLACATLALLGASVISNADDAATHTVTDMTGAAITVPVTVNHIAEQFPAHTVTDIMLGAGDRIVAIPQNVKTIPLLQKIYPGITKVPELFKSGAPVNMEDLLTVKPDVVSALTGGDGAKPFTNAGIPSVVMNFNTFEEFPRSIQLAGDVYGGTAKERAAAFVEYFQTRYKFVQDRLASLPDSQRPSVVHISNYPPLVIDGGKSLIDEWIKLGGGTDAASSSAGTHVTITVEQLLQWNPDVLIIQTPGGDQGFKANSGQSVIDQLAKAPGWNELNAVKTNRIYINPQGMYPWDRFGPEEALQIQWIAKTLHPDLFKDLDMRAEATTFYKNFFGYAISDAELDQIFQDKH
jgi:iron complex transport system substrate-binding protein